MPVSRKADQVRGAKCRAVADKAKSGLGVRSAEMSPIKRTRVRGAKCRDVADKAVLMVQSAEPLLALLTRLRKTSTRSLYAGRGRGDNLVGDAKRGCMRRV